MKQLRIPKQREMIEEQRRISRVARSDDQRDRPGDVWRVVPMASEASAAVDGRRRVLQVVLSLNPGGTERLVVEIVKRLRSEIPMAVCCLDDEGAWADEIKAYGVQVKALHRAQGFRPALGRAVADAARQHGASVIHCHHYSPFVYGCLARLWNPDCRLIFTEHGRLDAAPPSSRRRLANRALRRMPHEVFAVSESLRRHLIAEGFSGRDVEVIYNGIDVGPLPDARARARIRGMLGVGDHELLVGTIARLNPVKDLGTLIRATTALGRRIPLAVIVIGDGPERHALREMVVALTGTSQVRFLGHRGDARELLAGCDLYANTSISEGISLTILEAMAAGLPIVATQVGGTPEIIDATCGRLVPPRDPAALATALHELALQPAVRLELGRTGRLRVETRFTLDRMVREYRDAYCRVAA